MSAKRAKTHYEKLGVRPDVLPEDIKRAYRKLVKFQHPDLDHSNKSESEREAATEEMRALNEAYETLMDRKKRAAYDIKIGITLTISQGFKIEPTREDEEREKFLLRIYHPSRLAINKALKLYKQKLKHLSADPYDDALMAEFESYVDELESALRKASGAFASAKEPPTLAAAMTMMRHCMAQAVDGMEELRYYCGNYDYDHLSMAENLFAIALRLSRQSLELSQSG